VYLIGLLMLLIRKRVTEQLLAWSSIYLWFCLTLSLLIPYLAGYGLWYFDAHVPAPLTTYELTNGERSIVYQSMTHIGSEAYYEGIYDEFSQYIDDGYIAYLEGVQPGTEENMDTFTQML